MAREFMASLQAYFVSRPFVRSIGSALADIKDQAAVSIEDQELARKIWADHAKAFLKDMYVAHDNGAVLFGQTYDTPGHVEAWIKRNGFAGTPKSRRRNPDDAADKYRARIAAGGTLGAFEQKLFERALAREQEEAGAARREQVIRHLAATNERAKKTSAQDEEKALQYAHLFVQLLEKHKGPRVRVWHRGADVRVYFAGELGYVTVNREGIVSPSTHRKFHFLETSLYPSQRRAYRAALDDLHAERDRIVEAEWAGYGVEGAKSNPRSRRK
jgi:hypothetical protein